MTKIYNGTAHAVNIFGRDSYTFSAEHRKNIVSGNAAPVISVPKMTPLNAVFKSVKSGEIEGIDVNKSVAVSVDSLPEGFDFYVVSVQFVAACRELNLPTEKLVTVDGIVVNENLQVVGCTAFRQ